MPGQAAVKAWADAADAGRVELLNDLAAEWSSGHLLLVAAIVGNTILLPFLTLVHELGHAAAALALRRQLVELRVGDRDPIFSFRVRGFRVLLGPTSDDGAVGGYLLHRGSDPGPWVILAISISGPMSSLVGAVMTGIALVSLPLSGFSSTLLFATLGGVVVFWHNVRASGQEPSEWSDGSWIRFALRKLRAGPGLRGVDALHVPPPADEFRGVAGSVAHGSDYTHAPMSASLWPRVAELPLHVESYEAERLAAGPSWANARVTSQVRLLGSGADGLGEDVSLVDDDHPGLFEAPPSLPLAGEWTLGGFCEFVSGLDQWPEPPAWEAARHWRNWAFESAALDLALRQAGRPLHEVLGREPQPVRFVNSLGLGDDPSTETIHRRLETHPTVGFKLDAAPAWSPELLDDLAATGAVQQVDFKGHYGFEVVDENALVVLYERVVAGFPEAILEDPHDLPAVTGIVRPHRDRVAYDAPIRSAQDIAATPIPSRIVNVKPSRIGSLRALFELYAHAEAHGLRMYGGGMGELGVGRGQIELLASLFHAHEPNDVAPSAFNAAEPAADLPQSPLPPQPAPAGFRWGD